MTIEQKKNFIINIIYLGIITGIIYIFIKHIFVLIMPFLIGFIVALLLRPAIHFTAEKFHIPHKAAAILLILLFYSISGLFLSWISLYCLAEIKDSIARIPEMYVLYIEPVINDLFTIIEEVSTDIDPSIVSVIQDISAVLFNSVDSLVSKISSTVIQFISSFVSFLPGLFLGIVFAIIFSFFIAIDYNKIINYISKKFKPKTQSYINEVKRFATEIGFKYLKAYVILMGITFVELAVGLSILKVDRAISIAALIAVIDFPPILGTGGVIIPWIIFEFIKGNLSFAIGLTILYLIITVVRNILEPKLIGEQIGLHPIVMIICMYIGLKSFGFAGLIILPVIIAFLKHQYDTNKFQYFKQV
ncbi:MAG: sporulation integral membrane protein YtvI [Candidatus Caldatribacteriota bacterium]